MKNTVFFFFTISGLLLLTLPLRSYGQDFSRLQVPFIENGRTLKNALAGGMQNPRFSTIDLDMDGKLDLFVFDAAGGRVTTYLNCGSTGEVCYNFAPEYIDNFPTDLQSWALLRDYNEDGIEDIFSGFSGGIRLHRGSRNSDGSLSYEAVSLQYPGVDPTLNILQVPAGSDYTNVYVAGTDIPAIEDVDGDGDLDILTFDFGGSYVVEYRNYSKEFFLTDTMVFRFEDRCWGRFIEGGLSAEITLSDDCEECAIEVGRATNKTTIDTKEPVHAGSTMAAFDADGDGDFELILGDLTSPALIYLHNGGTPNDACISEVEYNYPTNDVSADIQVFLTSFLIDTNNDGLKDLITTTNVPQQNVNHVWMYLNVGSATEAQFQLSDREFLTRDMIHLGYQSGSAFTDYNADGLVDIVLSSGGLKEGTTASQGVLQLWQNTGTASSPAYTLVDDNLLRMKENIIGRSEIDPTFADIDGDGDQDAIVGDRDGFLYFAENTAGPGNPAVYPGTQYLYIYGFDNTLGQTAKPTLFDIDVDGDLDLVIGEGFQNFVDGVEGSLNFYENIGSITEPIFEPAATSRTLYGFTSSAPGNSFNYTDPQYIVTPDGPLLVTGGNDGTVYLVDDVVGGDLTTATVLTDKLGGIDVGRRSTISLADIDDDNYYEILVGNLTGGFELFNTDLQVDEGVNTVDVENGTGLDILISPSPNEGIFDIRCRNCEIDDVRIYSLDGSLIAHSRSEQRISIDQPSSGIYIVIITTGDKTTTRKIMIR